MLADENFQWNDEESERNIIDKIVDVDMLIENASPYGMEVVRVEGAWNKSFSDTEFTEFLKVYMKLIMKNPQIFLKVRWNTFVLTFLEGRYTISHKISNKIISSIIALTYNSLIPLILLSVVMIFNPDKKSLIFWLLAFGEAGCIFVLVTETSYMFHMLFVLSTWFSVVLCLKGVPEKSTELFPCRRNIKGGQS